jgi:hypothetical protein
MGLSRIIFIVTCLIIRIIQYNFYSTVFDSKFMFEIEQIEAMKLDKI